MPRHRDRGSVLIADLVLAAAIVIVVGAAASAAGIVAAADQADHEAARNAALWAARTGDEARAAVFARRVAPDATVSVVLDGETATATAATQVTLPHPLLGRIPLTVVATVTIPIAPYRSNRDG